jgi:molybdopterin synthase catalytic subunit
MATILYFGWARDCAGRNSEQIPIDLPVDPAQLWERLVALHPGLAECRTSARMAVDMEYVNDDALIGDAAEVAIIPPVAGG